MSVHTVPRPSPVDKITAMPVVASPPTIQPTYLFPPTRSIDTALRVAFVPRLGLVLGELQNEPPPFVKLMVPFVPTSQPFMGSA